MNTIMRCYKCAEEKSLDDFYNGFRQCKSCFSIREKQYAELKLQHKQEEFSRHFQLKRQQKQEELEAKTIRRCSKCAEKKSLADFHNGHRQCKPCFSLYAKRSAELKRQQKQEELSRNLQLETEHGRVCKRCGVRQALEFYPSNKRCRLGRGRVCKQCQKPRKDAARARYIERHGADSVLAAARERMRAMRDTSPDEVRAYRIAWRRQQREKLTDYYLVQLLTERSEYLKPGDIPPALLEVKRAHLLLLRAINQRKEVQSEERN